MNCKEKQLYIGKMTCMNCQNRIENSLKCSNGVVSASVSYKDGSARIVYDPESISLKEIERTIQNLGYEVLKEREKNHPDLVRILSFLAIIIALYVLLEEFGILNLLVPGRLADSKMSYGMLFIAGLLTSVHCIAMCGGINLSQSLPDNKRINDQRKNVLFRQTLLYNFGRVISYTVIGFLLGFCGMLIGGNLNTGVPVLLQGILKLIAGIIMLVMGINMLGLFPWLRRIHLKMPGFLTKMLGKKKGKVRKPFIVGVLNGLMPCGPLQSMQILAFASGNPISGALSMLLFSLGTVPLMLGLGTIVSVLGKKFTGAVINAGAVLVAVLGLAMLSQGGTLSGMLLPDRLLFLIIGLSVIAVSASLPFSKKIYRKVAVIASFTLVFSAGILLYYSDSILGTDVPDNAMVQVIDGVQIVNSTLSPGEYPSITVRAGTPVKWTINAPEGSINGCNYKMIIQAFHIEHAFEEGENIIEFTPVEAGNISYTCWMGMIRGNITVTENDEP